MTHRNQFLQEKWPTQFFQDKAGIGKGILAFISNHSPEY